MELRIQHGFSCHHPADRRAQFQVHGIFQNVSARARIQGLAHQGFLRMHAEHEHQGLRLLFENLSRGFQAVHLRHGAVHHHHLRLQLLRQTNRFRAVAGFAGHLDIRLVFENAPESAPHQAVVIHQQDRNFIRHANPFSLPDFLFGHGQANQRAAFRGL